MIFLLSSLFRLLRWKRMYALQVRESVTVKDRALQRHLLSLGLGGSVGADCERRGVVAFHATNLEVQLHDTPCYVTGINLGRS